MHLGTVHGDGTSGTGGTRRRCPGSLPDASWSPALLPRLIAASKADYYRGQLIFATERYFIIHSPVTSWTISLNLSCHVSDHLSPRMVTQRSWLVFEKHAGTFIKQVFISYGILIVQIRPTLLGGASICTMERRIVQESGTGCYRPLPCNGVKLVGYKSLCIFFPGWWGTCRNPSSTGARTARRGKGRRGTEYPR